MSADADKTRWNLQSLRLRIFLAILAWVALGIGGIWFSATRVFTRHVEMQYHDELDVHIRELAGLVRVGEGGGVELIRPLSDPRYLEPLSGFYWQVALDGGGSLRSPSMTRGSLDMGIASQGHITHRLEPGPTGTAIAYGLARPAAPGRMVHFVIATDQRLLDETLAGFTRELTVWLAGLAAALLLTGLAIVAFGFSPLDRLAEAMARLRRGQANRLEGQFPSEIAPVTDDLNAYIAHVEESIVRARVEAANLAHALRTPLAVIVDEAESIVRRPDMAGHGKTILDQSGIMVQQIEYRLSLARSAAKWRVSDASCKVLDVIAPILSAMRRLHPDKTFALDNRVSGEPMMQIDPVDLSELLSNLLDNAGKWSRGKVMLRIDPVGDGLAFEIADDGPGMRSGDMARAFEIGTRFDDAAPGSGLGLAIARQIANDYGLALSLGAGRKGGLVVRVDRAPAAP
ncbi:MAG: HAMP domain-containing histidine kinase [Sphingomonadales bacterium]|nr:HAMP domain-containing histidine kinase [Sphingomonadales bacterium]